jgi:hypothetical protein
MEFVVQDVGGQRFAEGVAGQPFMDSVGDVARLLEVCFDNDVRRLLLYADNLTARFFDLSSGEAGEILQKLRNYQVRLAVVRSATRPLSSRFGELLADEERGPYFRLFDEREAAQAWLCSS